MSQPRLQAHFPVPDVLFFEDESEDRNMSFHVTSVMNLDSAGTYSRGDNLMVTGATMHQFLKK